jgi:aminopeptidase N
MIKNLLLTLLGISSSLYAQTNHRDSIDVLHYGIHLEIIQISQNKVSGKAVLRFCPLFDNTSRFGFDLQRLTVDSIRLDNQIIAFSHAQNIIRFGDNQSFNTTDTLTAEIFYQGTPAKDPTGWGGFYFAGGQAFNLGVGMSVNPHVYGRAWYPCIDNFTDKAPYDFFITTLPNHKAICGGMLLSDTINGQGNKVWHWKLDQPTPTYLTSVAVADYQKVEFNYAGINGNIPVEIFCTSGQVGSVTTAFAGVPQMIQIFENAFGPYPFPRAGFSVISFSSGAMEHTMNIAYPNNAISTSLSDQALIAHELSHMWFGNNVTCATAEDMWMNEGWASYCEAVFVEGRDGAQAGKTYSLNNHKFVLQRAHVNDGAILPLYGIDHNNTYGTTVYKKGADVVRTLRGYLGDSLFFNAVKQWFVQNEFTSRTTHQFRDFLSENTGIDLVPFFDSWVFNAGFPHYALSGFEVNGTNATVEIRQSRLGSHFIGDANRVNVTFFNSPTDTATRMIEFDGRTGTANFELPFEPKFAIVDYHCLLGDATIKQEKMVRGSQMAFADQYFTVYPQTFTDSAWVHVTYNMVKPQNFGQIFDGIELTPHYYWTVNMESYGSFRGRTRFMHTTSQNPADTTWMPLPTDRMEMLYREKPDQPWTKLHIQNSLSWTSGFAYVDSLKAGEYAFGIWRYDIVALPDELSQNDIQIVPNPAKGKVSFILGKTPFSSVEIYSLEGKQMGTVNAHNRESIDLDISHFPEGTYIARFVNGSTILESRRFVVIR